mgnify:FL=1
MGNNFRQGIPAWNKGIPWSEDMKKKISIAQKGRHTTNSGSFKRGSKPWNAGKGASEEVRKQRRRDSLQRYKERHKDCTRSIHRCV